MTARPGYPDGYYEQTTAVDVGVHVHDDSVLRLTAYPAEDRVVLHLGEHCGELVLYVDGRDLDRLYGLLDDACEQLGRPPRPAVEVAPEAYASGWDAAIHWIETATDESAPATVRAAPGGVS